MRLSRRPGVLVALSLLLAVAGAVAVFAACGGGGGGKSTPSAAAGTSAYSLAGFTPDLPRPALVLSDTSGKPFDIKKDTAGQVTLLYVGYTHCPDICPTIMSDLAAVLKQMTPDQAAKVKVIFITSDPDRDTGPVLRKWLDAFNTSFIGLVPTQSQLQTVTSTLLMPPIEKEDTGTANYGVTHASFVFVFTQDNLAHLAFLDGMTKDDWLHDLPKLVSEGYKKPAS